MDNQTFWPKLKASFGSQKKFWLDYELKEKPGVTDRLIHYLITYYEHSAVARNALRIFRGIDRDEFGIPLYSGWSEVRVSTLRQIDDVLRQSGGKGNTWELAVTIQDFLENAWDLLDAVDLSDIPQKIDNKQLISYLNQLKGVPGACGKTEKGEPRPSPFRHSYSRCYKARKRDRQAGEPVLPSCAIEYLEYLWRRTRRAPFDNHANRVLARIGVFHKDDTISTKLMTFEKFTTAEKPIAKHRNLVQLGKIVCFDKNPRCNMCPVSNHCAYAKHR
jgi:hypothetical protein